MAPPTHSQPAGFSFRPNPSYVQIRFTRRHPEPKPQQGDSCNDSEKPETFCSEIRVYFNRALKNSRFPLGSIK